MRVVVHRYGWGDGRRILPGGIAKEIRNAGQLGGTTYVEPFLGRGSVYRAVAARKNYNREILNDIDCKRVAAAKKLICRTKKGKACERLTDAKPSCGRDWKQFLRYDSPHTVWYLDPPFDGVNSGDKLYKHNSVPLESILQRIRGLRGAVALSYKNTPEFRKKICKRPFRCATIKKSLFKNQWTELLAIKRAN